MHDERATAPAGGGLTRRMVGASALLAAVVGGVFAVLLIAIGDLRDAERRSDHSQRVLITANHLERLLLDLETGQRGFVLTREQRFLQPWGTARRQFPREAAVLYGLVAGDRAQERRVRRIAAAERAYIREYSLPLVRAARRGDPSARSVSATAAGKRRVDALRADFDALLASERRASTSAQASAESASRLAFVVAGVGLAGSIVLIALYAGYLARAIVRPVRRAASMAGRLAGGDLAARVPESGTGEIGALERAFNEMGRSLERSRDELAQLADEQAALRRVATLVARAAPARAVFAAVAEEVARVLPAQVAFIGRYDGDGAVTVVGGWSGARSLTIGERLTLGGRNVSTLVVETGQPARMDYHLDGSGPAAVRAHELGVRDAVGAPICVAGRLWGVMYVGSTGDSPLPPGTTDQLSRFTDLAGTAIANAEAQAEVAASRARIVATADETRRRIERDLHDGAQQRLVSLVLQLRTARASIPSELPDLAAELERVSAGLASTLGELREFARGIHPAILSEGGLELALRMLARRSALPVHLDVRTDRRLPEPIEVGAYYIVAEALTNAAKHAHASAVTVAATVTDDVLQVSVRDDGVGGAQMGLGSGLLGLRDRVEALGGRMSLESRRGGGTGVIVELPLDAASGLA